MRTMSAACCLLIAASIAHGESQSDDKSVQVIPDVAKYIATREAEFDQIPAYRKALLEELSDYVRRCVDSRSPAELTFICTHNSRRSQMAQVWARVAAEHYGLPKVVTYSGGTKATAFNLRAVAALKRAGFKIESDSQRADGSKKSNPVYQVQFAQRTPPLACFSKVFHQEPNPQKGFCAVMTCSQADRACPAVPGAVLRVALPFDDPKVFDNTPGETQRYDERCAQIARELLYVFSKVKEEKRVVTKDS